ncbi:MAG: DUF1566 domain-containing protein [Deltaproteobacteria bacterium]|nr:DUF1566 domain-containing protein [Deltaproteobacteria bacterium]
MGRPETAGVLGWPTCVGLVVVLGAGSCYYSFSDPGDGDHEAEALVEAEAGDEVAVDAASDGEADGDEDVAPEVDAATCADGWYDLTTGLCWQDPPDPTTRIWDDAVAYCDGLVLGGRNDWYLPTIDELRSLIRNCPATETGGSCNVTAACLGSGCRNPACSGCSYGEGPGGAYWPAELHGLAFWYWSSSRFVGDAPNAWEVDFDGAWVHREDLSRLFLVRCVRPGP